MPDMGQVRMACYRVMRQYGLSGLRRARVIDELRKVKVRPGSNRDLAILIDDFKREQRKVNEPPEIIAKAAASIARELWEVALATAMTRLDQSGGGAPVPKRKRQSSAKPSKGSVRLASLKRIIENLLRPDAKDAIVRHPLSPVEIYRRLTDAQSTLTDEAHIARDLAKISFDRVYQIQYSGKYWRNDRPVPYGYGEGQPVKRKTPKTGTVLSLKRDENFPVLEQAIAFMIREKRPVSKEEIADGIGLKQDARKEFYLALRNHLRAKNPRYQRNEDNKFSVTRSRREIT